MTVNLAVLQADLDAFENKRHYLDNELAHIAGTKWHQEDLERKWGFILNGSGYKPVLLAELKEIAVKEEQERKHNWMKFEYHSDPSFSDIQKYDEYINYKKDIGYCLGDYDFKHSRDVWVVSPDFVNQAVKYFGDSFGWNFIKARFDFKHMMIYYTIYSDVKHLAKCYPYVTGVGESPITQWNLPIIADKMKQRAETLASDQYYREKEAEEEERKNAFIRKQIFGD